MGSEMCIRDSALLVYLDVARPGVTSVAMIIGLAFAWSAGLAMRMQADLTRRLLQARGELTAAAAREERQRVARDIHDVVAHTMSVTMLHLAGARLALAEGEREEAMDSLRQAELSGRAAAGALSRSGPGSGRPRGELRRRRSEGGLPGGWRPVRHARPGRARGLPDHAGGVVQRGPARRRRRGSGRSVGDR